MTAPLVPRASTTTPLIVVAPLPTFTNCSVASVNTPVFVDVGCDEISCTMLDGLPYVYVIVNGQSVDDDWPPFTAWITAESKKIWIWKPVSFAVHALMRTGMVNLFVLALTEKLNGAPVWLPKSTS